MLYKYNRECHSLIYFFILYDTIFLHTDTLNSDGRKLFRTEKQIINIYFSVQYDCRDCYKYGSIEII